MDAITKFLQSRSDARNTYTSEDNLHMTRDGFMIPPPPPGPESNPILGGNEMQGFAQPTADDAMQERVPSNDIGGRMSDLATNALQLLGDDFGAAYQQYRIGEVENRIEDGSLQPVDYQMAVIENPTVPLGDYYDAASGTFSGVPSDDYILHQGQLYPRVITDAQTGEEIDLSEDNQLINFGRALMGGMMDPLEGVGVAARATQQLLRGGAPDPTVMNMGLGGATVPVDRATDVSDIGFYSAVNRAVEALPMEKGSASQMRAMIAKGEGVKPEEMAWIGLDDFLKGKKSVTKAEVQDYVQANQVQLEEVTKEFGSRSAATEEMQDILIMNNMYEDDVRDALETWEKGSANDRFNSQTEALIQEYLKEVGENRSVKEIAEEASNTQFSEYTLPGGENYREVLLTLPERRGLVDDRTPIQTAKDLFGDNIENIYQLNLDQRDILQRELDKQYKQGEKRLADSFTGGHFEEPNVLAHMRLNDRTGPNGERILFIEEIQSDWHQKGRKHGYKSAKGLTAKRAADPNFYLVSRDGEFIDSVNATSEAEAINVVSQGGVADAPLKKTWHEMAFRRVARMAAEEGYDAIAWTPGKMQAERYDLSKKIDALEYTPLENGQYKIEITDSDLAEVTLPNDGIFDASDLPNFVGQEIADKIVSGEGKKLLGVERASDFRYLLTGVDLEVGGEGMEGFYDKMLKNYAAKWGKKFGAKVGVTDIKSREYTQGEPVETGVPINEMNDQQLLGELGYSNIEDVETKVWTLPVTKKMRDSLMKKGAPLFTAGGAVAMSQVEREQNDN